MTQINAVFTIHKLEEDAWDVDVDVQNHDDQLAECLRLDDVNNLTSFGYSQDIFLLAYCLEQRAYKCAQYTLHHMTSSNFTQKNALPLLLLAMGNGSGSAPVELIDEIIQKCCENRVKLHKLTWIDKNNDLNHVISRQAILTGNMDVLQLLWGKYDRYFVLQ